MSSEILNHQISSQEIKRKRRGESKFNKQNPRYQCYCEKIYLSYPALYLHLKNKHPECFNNNRKIQATKFKQMISPQGFKILKMDRQKVENSRNQQGYFVQQAYQPKQFPINNYQGYQQFPFPNKSGYEMPQLPPHKYFMQQPLIPRGMMQIPMQNMYTIDSSRQKSERQNKNAFINQPKQNRNNIIHHLNSYFKLSQEIQALNQKERIQVEVMYSLLLKCIKEKSQQIKTVYMLQVEPIQSFDCNYIWSVLPYFCTKYLPNYLQQYSIKSLSQTGKQDRLVLSLLKVSKYFTNLQNTKNQIFNFQNWLQNNNFIEKINLKKIDI